MDAQSTEEPDVRWEQTITIEAGKGQQAVAIDLANRVAAFRKRVAEDKAKQEDRKRAEQEEKFNQQRAADNPEEETKRRAEQAQKERQAHLDEVARSRGAGLADDDPYWGPLHAPVEMVVFLDYQCPFCARLDPTLGQIRERYGDRVRIVVRDHPLSMHAHANRAAEAAGCAYEQGLDTFRTLHTLLFAHSMQLDEQELPKYAQSAGVDLTRFHECMNSGRRVSEIESDAKAAEALGAMGTPASFINGRFVSGAKPLDAFIKIIDEELAASSARN